MAKDVDLLSDYHNTYKRLSQTEHTDPESVREYLKEDNGGALMHGDVGPSTEYAPLVIIDNIRYFLNVKRDAAPLLGFEESQEELTEDMGDSWESMRIHSRAVEPVAARARDEIAPGACGELPRGKAEGGPFFRPLYWERSTA